MNAPVPPIAPETDASVRRTTCPYCGVGCGVLARPDGAGGASVAGDPDHPANFGRLCSKGSALGETLGLATRLLHPMARGGDGRMARVGWDTAIGQIAQAFGQTIERHGPDAVAFYLSGQLLTEDYYAANKLAKGFLGTANVDTNSRLCMASSVAGHRRAFGSDTVPGVYADLDEADLVVLVGSNAAWCHPILFRRLEAARAGRGTKLVVIDPRRTATVDEADLFLPVNPGKDTALFAGLLAWLADREALDHAYIDAHTSGFAEALASARAMAPDIEQIARETGIPTADLVEFYTLFTTHERTVTCYSQGVNQSAQGTNKVNAILNVHLATGRIGRPGMGPFSLTGQPNAMGGREVGGLANQLAAHMIFTPVDIDRVRRFWRAPRMAAREGLKAVEMFEAVAAGRIKALWIMGTNPAVSLPQAASAARALGSLDFLVVSENVATNDTVSCRPHLVLPALAWGEKDGTVTNSERRISRQRAFLPAPGEARADWWAMAQVGRRLGFDESFAWRSAADVFREHAALSGFENDGSRDFDLGGLASLDDTAFDLLAPVQWPVRSKGDTADKRFFADGHFFTPDRRAHFAVPMVARLATEASTDFPFILNTGRIRDQWHTMTRTGLSPRLGAHLPVPFVEIHPSDAAQLGAEDGALVSLQSAHGSAVLEARLSEGQKRGALFAPIHWSNATASNSRINDLVAAVTDPLSGQPESKAMPVRAAVLPVRFRGFILSRAAVTDLPVLWWAKVAVEGGEGYLIATDQEPDEWRQHAAEILGTRDYAEYVDAPGGTYRAAAFDEAGALVGAVFLSPGGAGASWDGLKARLAARTLSSPGRRNLLSGRGDDRVASSGPLVCACFAVSTSQIDAALAAEPGADVQRLGQMLRAGTNCGSCVPELRKLIQRRASADIATARVLA